MFLPHKHWNRKKIYNINEWYYKLKKKFPSSIIFSFATYTSFKNGTLLQATSHLHIILNFYFPLVAVNKKWISTILKIRNSFKDVIKFTNEWKQAGFRKLFENLLYKINIKSRVFERSGPSPIWHKFPLTICRNRNHYPNEIQSKSKYEKTKKHVRMHTKK